MMVRTTRLWVIVGGIAALPGCWGSHGPNADTSPDPTPAPGPCIRDAACGDSREVWVDADRCAEMAECIPQCGRGFYCEQLPEPCEGAPRCDVGYHLVTGPDDYECSSTGGCRSVTLCSTIWCAPDFPEQICCAAVAQCPDGQFQVSSLNDGVCAEPGMSCHAETVCCDSIECAGYRNFNCEVADFDCPAVDDAPYCADGHLVVESAEVHQCTDGTHDCYWRDDCCSANWCARPRS